MKKIAVLLISVMIFLNFTSCDFLPDFDFSNPGNNDDLSDNTGVNGGEENKNPTIPEDSDDKNNEQEDDSEDNESSLVNINYLLGLQEEIQFGIEKTEGFTYRFYYRNSEDSEYSQVDENLIIDSENEIDCYILGIKSGNYSIKIEAESLGCNEIKIVDDISVSAQDRSGYAHFNYSSGVGAYNDDGTVKEGTKIVYVTNENKNTVSLTINGTEYVGLVKILQAQHKSDTPLLIRVIGKIKTNQWNYKSLEPRLFDGSNAREDYFENTFSTEYGENLANLIVKIKANGLGAQNYDYRTTPTGLTLHKQSQGGSKSVSYTGKEFPAISGKKVCDDDSYYNMLEVQAAKNVTIEGVGSDAEFFQFGISFFDANYIEIKNLTFTDYPEDALNFLVDDRENVAKNGRYWIHNCTFNRGYNAWDLSGERDKYAGDGSVDFNNISNLTLSYNFFNNSKKSMLFGSGDSEACMNMTMHHNYFYQVESRLPLGRNVNIHSYNNYFDQCKNVSDIRKNSYIFSESNYFNSTSKPFIISSSVVKSFKDMFVNSKSTGAMIVNDRTQSVSSNCKPDGIISYSCFDTNSELFYYDSIEKRTDVTIMHDAAEVPDFVTKYAGAGYAEKFLEIVE